MPVCPDTGSYWTDNWDLERKLQELHFALKTCPEQAVKYISVTCILHNKAILRHQVLTVSVQNPAAPARNDGELQSSMDFSMPLYVP